MRISIVTICLNNEKDIRRTVESVINQTYPNVEFIVIDGKSSDNTLNIVHEYRDKIKKILSEPDQNLYDAINKGIKLSTGDVVGLIHAGDYLYNNQIIEKIVSCFLSFDIEILFGHSKIVNPIGKVVRINKSPQFKKILVEKGWMPSHQSIYVRRELFEKYGYYRTDFGGMADYEWFLRMFYFSQPKIKRLDEFILYFSTGGRSTKSYSSKLKKSHFNTVKKSWAVNGYPPPKGIVLKMWLRRPMQFFLAWKEQFKL
jgi:glycosyltransferase involved in cell wall biosynthesis